MPKQVSADDFDRIFKVVERYADGVGIDVLMRDTGVGDPSRRTLQRRLSDLVAAGRLVEEGSGRSRKYRVAPAERAVAWTGRADGTSSASGTFKAVLTPSSAEGRELEAAVHRAYHERTPVGYQRDFLNRYRPNVTAYLNTAERAQLHALARSPHAADRPAGTYARDILGRLLIDLSWASSRLEGNTYTRLDTQNLIELGLAAEGKDQREAQMILNHKAAIEMLVEDAEHIAFDRHTILNLHALLSDNLLRDPSASGRLRTIPVEISGTVYLPLAIPQQIAEHFDRLLEKAQAILDPFEQSLFIMVQLPYLQPFEDVNKRVSRLAANIPLIRRNLSPLSFVDVPEQAYVDGVLAIYELNRTALLRDVFMWAYERSCQRYVALKDSLPEPDPLRLRNREALIEVVGELVRTAQPIALGQIRDLSRPLVAATDLDQFTAMVFSDLHHLHEGNLARYRLRLSELRRWQEALAGGR